MPVARFQMPDGRVARFDVPDGTTPEQATTMMQSYFSPDFDASPPTDRQKLLSSLPMRLAKGGKDPIDGAAQFVQRVLPDGVVNAVNKAADFIGGPGTFAGDVLGIKGSTPEQMTAGIKDSNAEYDAARSATGQTGFDAARLAGYSLRPGDIVVGRFLP